MSHLGEPAAPYKPPVFRLVEHVSRPQNSVRDLRQSLSGAVLTDDDYKASLQRLLQFEDHKLNGKSRPMTSETSVGRGVAKSPKRASTGRLHWTMVSLDDEVPEEQRTFSWAVSCTTGVYHNVLHPWDRSTLPPVAQSAARYHKKHDRLPEYRNRKAKEVSERLYSPRRLQLDHLITNTSETVPNSDPLSSGVMYRRSIKNFRTFSDVPEELRPSPPKNPKSSRIK